jgi:hypothetical protein
MSCVPHSTHPVADRSAGSHSSSPGIKDRAGRLAIFLVAPFLVFSYYTAVTVLKLAGQKHA